MMPVYDYECESCGAFTRMRPMAECELTSDCPRCGADAPRAFLTAPYFSGMSSERRLAHAINECSAHAPQRLAERAAQQHGAGCGCCQKRPARKVQRGKSGAKSFPSARPWMLSH